MSRILVLYQPGIFVINPEGQLQTVDVSNASFARAALKTLLRGIKFVLQNDHPIRGTA